MSNDALRWAWPIPLSASCKLVLVRLADRANPAGACFTFVRTLQAETGLSRRGVQTALAELDRRGLVRRGGMHPSGATIYRVTLSDLEATQSPDRGRSQCAGAQPVRGGSAMSAPRTLLEPTEERTLLRSDAPAIADTSGHIAAEPFDARDAVWTEGLAILRRITGKPSGPARRLMGKLLQAAGDDCAGMLLALQDCPPSGDPIAWLTAAARARAVKPFSNRACAQSGGLGLLIAGLNAPDPDDGFKTSAWEN
jgi:hypothetical protein